MVSLSEVLRDVAELGTAGGVLIAAFQLRRQSRQARSDFEDQLAREYRELTARLPPEALLGGHPPGDPPSWPPEQLAALVQYIDLCNEQVYLHERKRISKGTWRDWEEGITHHLGSLPYFECAWAYVYEKTNQRERVKNAERHDISPEQEYSSLSYQHLAELVRPASRSSPVTDSGKGNP